MEKREFLSAPVATNAQSSAVLKRGFAVAFLVSHVVDSVVEKGVKNRTSETHNHCGCF
jgi:hypothetical protein